MNYTKYKIIETWDAEGYLVSEDDITIFTKYNYESMRKRIKLIEFHLKRKDGLDIKYNDELLDEILTVADNNFYYGFIFRSDSKNGTYKTLTKNKEYKQLKIILINKDEIRLKKLEALSNSLSSNYWELTGGDANINNLTRHISELFRMAKLIDSEERKNVDYNDKTFSVCQRFLDDNIYYMEMNKGEKFDEMKDKLSEIEKEMIIDLWYEDGWYK